MSAVEILTLSVMVGLLAFGIIMLIVEDNREIKGDEDEIGWEDITEINMYDKEETYEDCTVQVLENSVTGDVSVGWRRNSR